MGWTYLEFLVFERQRFPNPAQSLHLPLFLAQLNRQLLSPLFRQILVFAQLRLLGRRTVCFLFGGFAALELLLCLGRLGGEVLLQGIDFRVESDQRVLRLNQEGALLVDLGFVRLGDMYVSAS